MQIKMQYWIFIICVVYVAFYLFTNHQVSRWKTTDFIKDDDFIASDKFDIQTFKKKAISDSLKIWKTCPKQDRSLNSIIVSPVVDGAGIGNQIWAYLSVWAIARRNDIRPAMPEYTLNRMSKLFDRSQFRIPALRTIGIKCNLLPWILDAYKTGPHVIGSPKNIFRLLQKPAKENMTMIKTVVYIVDAFDAVPLWNELAHDLVINEKLRNEADQRLRDIRRDYFYAMRKNHSYHDLSIKEIEYVSVHIRRSDYINHMKIIYKNASIVNHDYYNNAFSWLQKQVNTTLIFIVLTDDMKWAQEFIAKNRTDVFMPGSGVYHDPFQDFALLAACNHSIFAYGTFAMTGALLANGGYTIVFDTGNKTVTKEMQFASALPRWYIMDKDGKLQYENEILKGTFAAVN